MGKKRIVVLGSTGSIGTQTLDIIRTHSDKFQIVGLAAGKNADGLAEQAIDKEVTHLGLADMDAARALEEKMPQATVYAGPEGLVEMIHATLPDLLIGAISGFAGLPGIITALQAGIDVALANKEPLVAAGHLIMDTARRYGARIIPIDSELSAVLQCLRGEDRADILEIILTASGGPFADLDKADLRKVTPEQALKHPNWRMGPKVTIDSATLANKGFEVFEVHWLFDVSFSQIKVVIHHQSLIHSLVQFRDTSVIGQLGWPDMRVPIQFALSYPERIPSQLRPLDLVEAGSLTFAEPSADKFPCLRLAREAGEAAGGYPAVLTGADEAAVELFLAKKIGFTDIPMCIEKSLEAYEGTPVDTLQQIEQVNGWAKDYVRQIAAEA